MSDNEAPPVTVEIYEMNDSTPEAPKWNFRFRYANGQLAGHDYNSQQGATDGFVTLLEDLLECFEAKVPSKVVPKDADG